MKQSPYHAARFAENPIITPDLDARIGENINGPSLIRTPEWLENPLGRYYLYFAHHAGDFIRLAYADRLEGPWSVYGSGTLRLEESGCRGHIASPDVHVDQERKEIRMYYHGPVKSGQSSYDAALNGDFPIISGQRSRVALSKDGLRFERRAGILGAPYFRVFRWKGMFYALGMPGVFYRSENGITGFVKGPHLFSPDMRHCAVRVEDGFLEVFYSNAFDQPERILLSKIELLDDWMRWKESEAVTVLAPEKDYEGGDLPLKRSERGLARKRVRQLRDPALYEEDGNLYLLYSVAGENGIAIARLLPREG